MSAQDINDPVYEPCEGCAELLDVSSFGPFDSVVCPICSVETKVKRTFDKYQLQQRFAVGGMSVIFEGWDTTLDRKVAIKVLNEEYCRDELRIQAFENEARLTAQVNHPNVIQVYSVGRAYGRFYLVMELLEGSSFERAMAKRGALPEDEVLEVAQQVAGGLEAAKKAGMIHRDIKPGNILLDPEGRARIIDFGLALITKDGRAQAEEIWATPYYVPPEALEQGIEDVRSDIYAFGATLYHALAGRPPFETTSNSNSVLRQAKQTIPPLCRVAPWVSPNTGATVDRMMAFAPENRWPNYPELMAALEQAKLTIGQKPATPIHSQTRVKRRSRSGGFTAMAIFLALSLIVGLLVWQPWQSDGHPDANAGRSGDAPVIDFNPTGGTSLALQRRWTDARAKIASGDFEAASRAFAKIPTTVPLEKAWAILEASVAQNLAGHAALAREIAAQPTEEFGASQKCTRCRELAKNLASVKPPSKWAFPGEPKDLIDWMSTFALALKQWNQGQWEKALPHFAKVRSAKLPADLAWFQVYQDLADTFLADGQILARLDDSDPKDAEQAERQIADLEELLPKLRTQGRAAFHLQARQAYLTRLHNGFESGPSGSSGARWDEVKTRLGIQASRCQFVKMGAILDNPPSNAPAKALRAWRYLHRNAARFLADFQSRRDWTATTKDGREFRPRKVSKRGLKDDNGDFVNWAKIDHVKLLEQHTGKAVHAVAFAALLGLSEQADALVEELVVRDKDFRDQWREVIVGMSL